MMGLRLDEGVDLDRLSARFGMPMDGLVAMRQVALYRDLGFVTLDGSRLTVTARGMVLLDGLLGELVQPELLLS